MWSGVPAHPLRRRLRSIWLSSDLATDVRFVQPATHPLSLRLREIALPRYRQCSSRDRRNVIRSTIYSGSTFVSVVAIKPESKGRHHSISRQPALKPLSGFVSGSSAGRHAHRAFARQVARFLTDSAFGSLLVTLPFPRIGGLLRGNHLVRSRCLEHRVKDT